MLLQTDGANPTPHERPGRRWEVEGRRPEEGEDSMTGWMTVRRRGECQVETKTEEMKTPKERRITDSVPNPPLREGEERVAADLRGTKWWEVPNWWLSKKEREEFEEKQSEMRRRRWEREWESRQQERGGEEVCVAEQGGGRGGDEFYFRE